MLLESWKLKNRDKQMTYIVRVSTSGIVNCPLCRICLGSRMTFCFLLLLTTNVFSDSIRFTIILECWHSLVKVIILKGLVQVDQ
jgi:hypothetical protein